MCVILISVQACTALSMMLPCKGSHVWGHQGTLCWHATKQHGTRPDSVPACDQVFVCVGILVAYIAGLPYDSNEPFAVTLFGRCVAWWRIIFGLGVLPALLQARSHRCPWPRSCRAGPANLPMNC